MAKLEFMRLIIAEKPTVAEKIAAALGKNTRKAVGGVAYYEVPGKNAVVAPAVGHLFSLHQKTPGSGYPVFEIEWVPGFEADEVVNACDWDVEGSTIGGNIIEFLAKGKKAERMFFSTLTKEDLTEAYENLKPLDIPFLRSGQTRHTLDWLWGINVSRALMGAIRKAGVFRIMSMGRVQGPALAFLSEKELKIKSFVSTPYWQVFAYAQRVEFLHKQNRFCLCRNSTPW